MRTYKIKKDKHRSGLHLGFTFGNKIEFEAEFDSACLYHLVGTDKYDINKLFGMSTSYHHHKNSCRFGWRCIDGENIEILAYVYVDGVRQTYLDNIILGTVKPNEKFHASISIDKEKNKYVFSFNGNSFVEVDYKTSKLYTFKYKLYPYFGGNRTAPQKMKIKIRHM